jgi:2-polyprenyl-3-methyl-5-hydroxy-6-metoxy-1,4-benzoquinol methylase
MSETFERITPDQVDAQAGHVYRYEFARDWVAEAESVLDIACGIGYGAKILAQPGLAYVGIDKIEPDAKYKKYGRWVSGVDLNTYELDSKFDVAVCFETLEHLQNPQHLADQLMANARTILVSVPTRPTKHMNEYHLHDFTVDDVVAMFDKVELFYLEDQPEELSHIFVFGTPDAS